MSEVEFVSEETALRQAEENEGSVKSLMEDNSAGGSTMPLIAVFESLVLLGLSCVERWETIVAKLKTNPDIMSNGELLSLYYVLSQLAHELSNKLVFSNTIDKDFSQDKVYLYSTQIYSVKEMMSIGNSIMKKKPFKDRRYNTDIVMRLQFIVRGILTAGVVQKEIETEKPVKPDSVKKPNKNKRKSLKSNSKRPSKKQKRSVSPAASICSSSSSTANSSSNSGSDSGSDSSESGDMFEKLFKHQKSKSPAIKQIFQTQKHKLRRKMQTPGERGRFMVKIEITDVKDLRKCSSPKTYWTKVSKKAVFLTEEKDDVFKTVNQIVLEVGQKISKTKGVEFSTSSIVDNFNKDK